MIPYQPMKFISPRFGQIGIILLGFLLFFGCASAPSHIAKREEIMSHAASAPLGEIRILTINVWSGLTYKGFFKMGEYEHHPDRRYELLVSEIRNLDPDILAIQEANPLPYYVERLAADLNYQAIYRVALGESDSVLLVFQQTCGKVRPFLLKNLGPLQSSAGNA